MTDNISKKRNAVLDDLRELIDRYENHTGDDLTHVSGNIHNARDKLHDDGEYNYNVRLALHQLRMATEDDIQQKSLREEVGALSQNLADRADLPPEDEITRT